MLVIDIVCGNTMEVIIMIIWNYVIFTSIDSLNSINKMSVWKYKSQENSEIGGPDPIEIEVSEPNMIGEIKFAGWGMWKEWERGSSC